MDGGLEFLVAAGPGRPATSGQETSAAGWQPSRALPGVGITGLECSLAVRAARLLFASSAACLALAGAAAQAGTSREAPVTGAGAAVIRQGGMEAAFAARLQQATAQLSAGRPEQAIETCRQVLRDTESSRVDRIATRGEAYRLILQAAAQLPLTSSGTGTSPALFHGNPAADRLVREEQRAYADRPDARVPGLIAAARWYAATDQPTRQRVRLRELLGIIEMVDGPRSPRLAEPLLQLGMSRVLAGTSLEEARRAFSRGLDLEYAEPLEAAATRALFYAALGDVDIVFGGGDSGASSYKAAWQTLADAFGAGVADQAFAEPRVLRSPQFLVSSAGEWLMLQKNGLVVTYTIDRDGTITDIVPFYRGERWSASWFSWGVREGFARARYRPRLSAGVPVDTVDQTWDVGLNPSARVDGSMIIVE